MAELLESAELDGNSLSLDAWKELICEERIENISFWDDTAGQFIS